MPEKTILEQIDLFLKQEITSYWMEDKFIRIYLRKQDKLINGTPTKFIVIANVEIIKKSNEGKGLFKEIILHLENEGNVFVENVLNLKLKTSLMKHGYSKVIEIVSSFYKIK